jgi:importin subunit beta-1
MNSEHSGVALQAVEFWSTVCDEELELQEEANEALDMGEQPERVSFDFAKTAAPEILPVLLWMLTQQVGMVHSHHTRSCLLLTCVESTFSGRGS